MIRSLIIPFIILYLGSSCKKEDEKTYFVPGPATPPSIPADSGSSKTYLALGDSYTIGQSV
ncbi:MAG: hypothetical protein ABIS01_16020, partial [Ferruginibacter sp.]